MKMAIIIAVAIVTGWACGKIYEKMSKKSK